MQVLDDNEFLRDHHSVIARHAASIARRWRGHIEPDDLVGVGLLATLQAARSFDESRRVPLAVHTARAARWAMLSEARTHALVRRGAIDRRRAMQAAESIVEQRTGQPASTRDVARELGMPVEAIVRWRREGAATERIAIDDIESALPAVDESPEDRLITHELLTALRIALTALPPRLERVVRATYLEGRVLADVAAELGVTESRVSQLRAEGIELLRVGLGVLLGDDDREDRADDRHGDREPRPCVTAKEPRRVRAYRDALALARS